MLNMTPPSQHPALGIAVYDSMERCYPAMPLEHRAAIRSYFLDAQPTTRDVLPSIQAWLSDDETLANRVLAQPGHMVTTAFAPLLVWALSQEWGSTMDVRHTLGKWGDLVQEDHSDDARSASAAVFCTLFVQTMHRIPMQHREQTCGQALRIVDMVCPHYTMAGQEDAQSARDASTTVAIQQGYILNAALAASLRPENSAYLTKCWRERWIWTLLLLDDEQAATTLCALLDSNMSPDVKRIALSTAVGGHWCHPDVHARLLPLLPTREFERALELPWAGDSGANKGQSAGMLAHRNQNLMHLFCPQLHTQMSVVATQSDWATPETLRSLVQLCRPGEPGFGIPLPADYSEDTIAPQ